ncbi:DUF6344 domain-containing protein [Streptomyces sp. NPDC048825]|uniref:DUF6344 domain-containing protein n=1 Tax=Streptomyces sp. NPDC048825 TaxID=3365592 RepID=UPI00371FF7A6
MARNKVMKLWTAVITAFIALCTALGLVTTADAATAVSHTEAARKTSPAVTAPTMSRWTWSFSRTLPPTMKQRIHAEAHGSSPSCRHRPPTDVDTPSEDEEEADSTAPCTT